MYIQRFVYYLIWFSVKLCIWRTKSNMISQYRHCKGLGQAHHLVPSWKHYKFSITVTTIWLYALATGASLPWNRGKRKKTYTWCFCCRIRTLFFIFIGLIIIHVDLTEMEGEAAKTLSDKVEGFHSVRNPSHSCHHCTKSAGWPQTLPWWQVVILHQQWSISTQFSPPLSPPPQLFSLSPVSFQD